MELAEDRSSAIVGQSVPETRQGLPHELVRVYLVALPFDWGIGLDPRHNRIFHLERPAIERIAPEGRDVLRLRRKLAQPSFHRQLSAMALASFAGYVERYDICVGQLENTSLANGSWCIPCDAVFAGFREEAGDPT